MACKPESRPAESHMILLDRRGFIKTCVVSAAAARYSPGSQGLNLLPTEGKPSAFVSLENGEQQLRVTPEGEIFAFQNFLRVTNEWRPATLPGNVLVTGPAFPLRASRISRSGAELKCE